MSKGKRDGLIILMFMIIGFGTGFILSFGTNVISNVTNVTGQYFDLIVENIIWVQVTLVVVLLIPAILLLQRSKKYFAKADANKNLEDDSAGEKANQILFQSMVFNRLYTVLSFVAFGLAPDLRNLYIIWSILIFLIFLFINGVIDTQTVRLIQKEDPMKKGDPVSLKFSQQYFSSLDEAEKEQVYKASYLIIRISLWNLATLFYLF